MITIDGSEGEGGGQVLRTSLTLALATGRPFRIENIRANRKKPGLLRQHLTAVRTAAQVGDAVVDGAELGSLALEFRPGKLRGGTYDVAIGSAGSACLVLQTILPALALAPESSEIRIEGGTHNPLAPTFECLERAFVPIARRMGAKIALTLERPGFYPAGGGRIVALVHPIARFEPIEIMERGEVRSRRARAIVAQLPRSIAERELAVVGKRLSWDAAAHSIEECGHSAGPGNVLSLEIECDHVTEVFTGFGERDVSAERVAEDAVQEARAWLASCAPIGPHLADQLLVPFALAGGGAFATMPLTRHTTTNADVIRRFLPVGVEHGAASGRNVVLAIAPR
jgi:RNA 3'-terminal phosphate cyclase (ATP)